MKKEVIEKLAALITAAFGLVAALAWNDAIKTIFIQIFGPQSNIPSQIIYAVMVTFIAVWATIKIGHATEKVNKKRNP